MGNIRSLANENGRAELAWSQTNKLTVLARSHTEYPDRLNEGYFGLKCQLYNM